MRSCTEEQFLKDVAKHRMGIVKDEGLDRDLKFRQPGTNCYHFDIRTWPGALCITGVHLIKRGAHIVVSVACGGAWIEMIRERWDGEISHFASSSLLLPPESEGQEGEGKGRI